MCAYGCRKAETLRYFLQRPCKGQTANGRLSGKHALHCLILIAVYCGAVFQSLRHAMGIEVVALGTVYAEAHQLLLSLGTRDVAKSVAVGKGSRTSHHDVVAANLLDEAHALARTLWGDGIAEVGGASVHEVVGKATVETTLGVGGKGQLHPTLRGGAILPAPLEDGIQVLAVPCRYVLHIGGILQAALYLQRTCTGIEQSLQMCRAVHVAHRQEITALQEFLPIGGFQVVGHTAELGTLATVGATSVAHLRGIAPAVVTDTDGTVYEHLQRHVGHLAVYVGNLLYGEFARKHHLLITLAMEPLHLLCRAVVHLRGGMQGYRGHVGQEPYPLVLDNEGIHPYAVHAPCQVASLTEFLLALEQGVERNVHLHTEGTRILHHPGNVLVRVASRGTCPEACGTYVDGISTMVDGGKGTLLVACRCEEFYLYLIRWH